MLLVGVVLFVFWLFGVFVLFGGGLCDMVLVVVVFGVFFVVFGYVIWIFVFGYFGVVCVVSFFYLMLVVVMFLLVVLMGEWLGIVMVCGGLFVIVGVIVVVLCGCV